MALYLLPETARCPSPSPRLKISRNQAVAGDLVESDWSDVRTASAEIETSLSTKQCAAAFQEAAARLNGGWNKAMATAMKFGPARDIELGFYTPRDDSPFSAVEDAADFSIGFSWASSLGGSGKPGHVQMYVTDRGSSRTVEIVAPHGLMDRSRAERAVEVVAEAIRSHE